MKSIVFIILFIPFFTFAQSKEQDVKNVINMFFEGMKSNDSLVIKETLYPSCEIKTIAKTKEGKAVVHKEDMQAFIKSVGTKRENISLYERIISFSIQIDGDLAIAWTPYEFYLNNAFSHCGVNAFTLIKQENEWKIVSIIDTRRKNNCQ